MDSFGLDEGRRHARIAPPQISIQTTDTTDLQAPSEVPTASAGTTSYGSTGFFATRTGFTELFSTPSHPTTPPSRALESTPLTALSKCFMVPPEDSVYSYFMFMPPIDQRRTKRHITPLICLAFVLVLINFVMQVGLLGVVGSYIMKKQSEWVSGMIHIHPVWYHIIPMPYNYPPPRCVTEDRALCMDKGDGISCAPSSIHLITDWSLLDRDGDGVWSRSEAADETLREVVQCDYGVDLLSLYNSIAHQLNTTELLKGRRGQDLLSGVGIHKAYFNWYLHKPLLCQYGDSDMCGPMFQRGFFDEALRQQTSADFADTSTAMKYCTQLLQQECFDILPNTYRVWRSRNNQQCGDRVFGQSMYQVPDGLPEGIGGKVPMLTVGFTIQDIYDSTKGVSFRFFLCILLVTFLSVMFLEMRSITKVMTWAITFPKDHDAGIHGQIVGRRAVRIIAEIDDSKKDSDDEDSARSQAGHFKQILAVRPDHRIAVLVVTAMRVFLWLFLMWSGIMFLTGQPRYLTLIFDALSLVFIFEIDELLFNTMLRHEFKEDHLTIEPMKVDNPFTSGFSGRRLVLVDILQFFGIIAFAMLVVYSYCTVELDPLIDSIACLCSRDGPRCYDAQHFSKAWWDRYWSTTLPAANLIIDQLKDV